MIASTLIENEVIGSLLLDPTLLISDMGMSLSPTDFTQPMAKQIYIAFQTLFADNLHISDKEILKFLEKSNADIELASEYMFVIKNTAEPNNFLFNIDMLKKYGLLRDLDSFCDVGNWFSKAPLAIEQRMEMERKLKDASISEIVESVFGRVVGLSDPYIQSGETNTQSAADGIMALLESLEEAPDYGVPTVDGLLTTITRGTRKKKVFCFSGGTGSGKAVPNNTLIPTPMGWRRVHEIKVGDQLFDRHGRPTNVIGVFPQGEKEVFKVTFEDGRTALCNDEHLWSYYNEERTALITASLKDMMRNGKAYHVPVTQAVDYKEKPLPFKPISKGLYVGITQKNLTDTELYLTSSISQRVELLRGLIVATAQQLDKEIFFTIKTKEFEEFIYELVRSLGMVITHEVGYIHRVSLQQSIAITSIESLGYSTPMTCFMVDNEEHLFLMNDYIVTHNTRIAVAQAVKCSIPVHWDLKKQKWAYSGCDEISGICTTEMGFDETQTIILATISGVDESKIIESTMTDAEKKRVYQAAQILAKYEKNLYIWRMPDPNIKQLISGVRKMRLTHNLDNLFNSKDCVIPFQSVAGVI